MWQGMELWYFCSWVYIVEEYGKIGLRSEVNIFYFLS
jgi:hypothetical protein